eukprot:1606483-Prymnesium_polylepis.1
MCIRDRRQVAVRVRVERHLRARACRGRMVESTAARRREAALAGAAACTLSCRLPGSAAGSFGRLYSSSPSSS